MLLTACSTTRMAAPSDAIADLTSSSKVAVAHYEPEKFMIWPDQQRARGSVLGMFGLIGASIDAGLQFAEAKEATAKFISASQQLMDPITHVESRFLTAWQQELRLIDLPASQLVSTDSPQKLFERFGTGYVIDFKTERWTVDATIQSSGLSSTPDGYRPSYTARARLVRLNDQKIVWQGTCEYSKDDSHTPKLTPYDITGIDQGGAVKAAMQKLAEVCADSLWRQFFARESGPELPPTTVSEVAK